MEITNLISAATPEQLRAWLQEHGRTDKFVWVEVTMTPKPGKLLYLDAVEQCLCFGWIDGTKKKTADDRVVQRLSPRSKKSSWTELNKARVRRLEKLGLMTDEGRKVLPNMDEAAFIIDPDIAHRLMDDSQVYANFMAFPPLYRTIRIDTIQSYKNDPELFNRRLEKFIANTRDNIMYGQWHDHGRLLD